ncbi:alpha/beta hydrolase [Bradyrhizobium ganzhouense]|uniref:alpha/beta hydrolase n=1 Tax=Bradyrhizobium ganzhouense TaxID=1179767 RepID=UPI003CF5F011
MRPIFFATDRKIDFDALAKAKSGGILIGSEDYFLNRFDPMLRYGYVEVSAPPRRSVADQNYESNSRSQNTSKHFALWNAFLANSTAELKEWTAKKYQQPAPTILYVHGIDNSFHDAAERLAQMEIDYRWEGPPLLFSWPSDTFRWFKTVPGLPLTPENYRKIQRVGLASELYLVQTIRDLLSPGPYHIEAHSMGSLLTADAIHFIADSEGLSAPAQGILPTKPVVRTVSPSLSTNLLLVAPDIATREFMKMREAILTKVRHITIYCSDDSILGLSRRVNGNERLGSCPKERTPAEAVSGIDFVRVTGCTSSTWDSHSVHLSVPEVIADISKTLADAQELGLPPPGRDREIRCTR